jgi:hypothetical protein
MIPPRIDARIHDEIDRAAVSWRPVRIQPRYVSPPAGAGWRKTSHLHW